eukprot:6213855-Pleurochrysis_carterae.AAC.1
MDALSVVYCVEIKILMYSRHYLSRNRASSGYYLSILVTARSGQCRKFVRARAGRNSKSDGRRPESYESSEAGPRRNSCAGVEVGGE